MAKKKKLGEKIIDVLKSSEAAKVRVRMLTPIAGAYLSAAPGDIVTFPEDEAMSIIDSGAGEAVDTDEAKLCQMAEDAGFDLVPKI